MLDSRAPPSRMLRSRAGVASPLLEPLMSRLLVPFLALVLAAIVPLATPAQAAPQDQDQVARATSTEPTARQHPRHHRTSSAHNTRHRHTQHAHSTSTT